MLVAKASVVYWGIYFLLLDLSFCNVMGEQLRKE